MDSIWNAGAFHVLQPVREQMEVFDLNRLQQVTVGHDQCRRSTEVTRDNLTVFFDPFADSGHVFRAKDSRQVADDEVRLRPGVAEPLHQRHSLYATSIPVSNQRDCNHDRIQHDEIVISVLIKLFGGCCLCLKRTSLMH